AAHSRPGLRPARLPVGPDHPGVTAGANFQPPYRASFLLPHRRSAWLRFAERLDELAAFAASLHPPTGADAVAAVSAALSQTGSNMMDYVEAGGYGTRQPGLGAVMAGIQDPGGPVGGVGPPRLRPGGRGRPPWPPAPLR